MFYSAGNNASDERKPGYDHTDYYGSVYVGCLVGVHCDGERKKRDGLEKYAVWITWVFWELDLGTGFVICDLGFFWVWEFWVDGCYESISSENFSIVNRLATCMQYAAYTRDQEQYQKFIRLMFCKPLLHCHESWFLGILPCELRGEV
ncbi:hypothetical protein EAF04_005192 [Stromatinia cepivora]|nr:hypothetical protein EAF04_005192 [Stromatinia cepivora]